MSITFTLIFHLLTGDLVVMERIPQELTCNNLAVGAFLALTAAGHELKRPTYTCQRVEQNR